MGSAPNHDYHVHPARTDPTLSAPTLVTSASWSRITEALPIMPSQNTKTRPHTTNNAMAHPGVLFLR